MAEKTSLQSEPEERRAQQKQQADSGGRKPKNRRWPARIFWAVLLLLLGTAAGIGSGMYIIWRGSQFEDIATLQAHKPVLFTRVYDRNGQLIDIISSEKRIVLDFADIPRDFVHALVAVEDEYFFEHIGVSPLGILAAVKDMLLGGRVRGASTLTQQLVKNITKDKRFSLERKLKEQFLAVQVEMRLTKEEIFAMYANEVPFGNQQFGIEAAARYYFGKSVGALTLVECATLAGIPQAPTAHNPYRRPKSCIKRRNIVLQRMFDEGYIGAKQLAEAKKAPLELVDRKQIKPRQAAAHFVDKVRGYLFAKYGEERVRTSGWDVHTTLDLNYQVHAENAVREGLKEVDKAMGYRAKDCPSVFAGQDSEEPALLTGYYDPSWHNPFQPGISLRGVVMEVHEKELHVRVDQHTFVLTKDNMSWLSFRNKRPMSHYFKVGDVPLFTVTQLEEPGRAEQAPIADETAAAENIEQTETAQQEAPLTPDELETLDPYQGLTLMLDQEPSIEGAFFLRDPTNGGALAMVGGYDYNRSKFNRAEQARRQAGSSFKPVIFGAALEQGYTLSDSLFDEPTQFIDPTLFYVDEYGRLQVYASKRMARRMRLGLARKPKPYQPHNYHLEYDGWVTMRQALARSKNIVSVKLLNSVGYDHVIDYALRLRLNHESLQPFPSMALGAMEFSLEELVTCYGIFGQNGVRYQPRFITLITDNKGRVIEQNRPKGEQVISPRNAYLITDALTSVVEDEHGTGKRARALDLNIAGKTGTTDDYTDTWFIGYTPELTAGAWVGRDLKKTIGRVRTGANTALPIWLHFFKAIRGELEKTDFPMPEGLIRIPIDKYTGKRITSDCDCSDDDLIFEVYEKGTETTEVCRAEEKTKMNLPWYLQKRTYEYDPEKGALKPSWEMIDYPSQRRANALLKSLSSSDSSSKASEAP